MHNESHNGPALSLIKSCGAFPKFNLQEVLGLWVGSTWYLPSNLELGSVFASMHIRPSGPERTNYTSIDTK